VTAAVCAAATSQPDPLPDTDDDQVETEAPIRAVEDARRDQRAVPRSEMREWLLRIEAGEFDAEPPTPRLLGAEDANPPQVADPIHPLPDFDGDAEAEALGRAVAEARADPREVPRSEVRAWLMQIAAGNFDAAPPVPRIPDSWMQCAGDCGPSPHHRLHCGAELHSGAAGRWGFAPHR